MYFGAPSLPYGKMGYVEDGDYASRAYEKDEYIIWKGGNYFAKTDILQGAEFVVDTNLTAIPEGVVNGIMAKVSALNDHLTQFETQISEQIYDSKTWDSIRYIKIGKIVFLQWLESWNAYSHTYSLPWKVIGQNFLIKSYDDGSLKRIVLANNATSFTIGNEYAKPYGFYFTE